MSGAHAPRRAIPHMSRPGCELARCVHRAASGSRRPRRGRSRLPGRRFVPASDVAHARTHWRAACKWGGAASSLPLCEPLQACLAVVRIFGGGRAVGVSPYADRCFAAACSPLGATTIVLHSRKEGTFVRPSQRACFRCGSFPLIPTPVSASRTLPCVCRARRRRDPGSPTSLAWRCCEPERACVCVPRA